MISISYRVSKVVSDLNSYLSAFQGQSTKCKSGYLFQFSIINKCTNDLGRNKSKFGAQCESLVPIPIAKANGICQYLHPYTRNFQI